MPPQESNFNAEQLVPAQVPARASDGKRYPEPLQDGVDTTPDDPKPRSATAICLILQPPCKAVAAGHCLQPLPRLALLLVDRADVVRGTVEPVADKFSADAALNR